MGNIPNNAETRRKYRQMLFSCSKADLAPLSAVILHNETLYQKNDQEVPLLDIIAELGIVPGVTLDKGWVELAGTDGREVFTQGLDDLDARCKEYKRLGCQFAKWRMVVSIAEDQALLQLKKAPEVLQCMPQCARGMGLFRSLNRTL